MKPHVIRTSLTLLAGATLFLQPGPCVVQAATQEVDIVDSAFSPPNVTINSGDSVRWTHRGTLGHSTTSGAPPGTPDGLWDSGTLAMDDTYTVTFNGGGDFPYYCTPHALLPMEGSVHVNAGPPPFAITNFGSTASSVTVGWSGGTGPFGLQRRASAADPVYGNLAFTETKTATARRYGAASVYQIVDMASHPALPFTVVLSGALERPTPVTTTATGSGTMQLNGNVLSFDIRYGGLSGPPTASHIHGAAPASQAAGVIINLFSFIPAGSGSNGVISGQVTLTAAQKAMILAGKTYVNIHTAANSGGEIRGQINPVGFQALASGAQENPPVNTAARGIGSLALAGRDLSFNITYSGLSGPATLSHFHGPAGEGTNTSVMIDLAPFNGGAFGASGTIDGTVSLTDAQLAALSDGLLYFNIHTVANGGGEIRGQVLPQSSAVPLTSFLSGLNERPTQLTNTAAGSAVYLLEGSRLTFNVRYTGLSGPATAAHFHSPASASNSASVSIGLAPYNNGGFGTSGALFGSILLTPEQRSNILAGLTYVNLHTAANPGGEVRGQLVPVLATASLSGANERPTPVVTAGTGSGHFALIGNKLYMNVTYANLSGTATAAHIHGPANTNTAANVLVSLAPFNGGAFGASGSLFGVATLAASDLANLIDGLTYVNFHTSANGGGEIRGQIVR